MSLFILQLLLVIVFLGTVAALRPALPIWASGFAVLLFILTVATTPPWLFLVLCWLALIAVAVGFGHPKVRHEFITKPILNRLRKVLPPMSETERIALEAGDVWWEAELFQGRPDWQKLMNTPLPALSKEEQLFVDNQVEELCSMLDDWKITHEYHDLPPEVWGYLKQERFLGLVIPKEFGGLGFSAIAHSTIVAKIASRSTSTAVSTMVPNSLGPGELLAHYGTPEQKQYYLPRLARGEEIPCFGLTAPEAGSDATAIPDTGIICKGMHDGKEIIGIKLNFDKRYITLAPVATVIGVAFKLYDPAHLLSAKDNVGITLCLLPANHPGVEVGDRHLPADLAFMNGVVRGKDVFIPLDWIIGGVTMAGQGWRMLMECLSIGRSISLPALSLGVSQLAYRTTGAYAHLRKQFKLPIGKFEGVEEGLAQIAGYTYMLEATRRLTAAAVDSGIKPSLASAIAKYHMTEMARKTLDWAMDIHAGRAVQYGPRNYLGLPHQAIPVSITVEGANILTRNLIIFGQGAIRCHKFVREEMALADKANTEQGFIQFDKVLLEHMGFTVSNLLAAFAMGLGGVYFVKTPPQKEIAGLYRQLTRMSTALALTADVAMLLLGGALKRKERLSARLGDVLSNLYIAASVLKYYHDQNQAADDLIHVEWAVQTCLANIQKAFDEFFINFPNKLVGCLLRFMIFPLGRVYRGPSDALSQRLAQKMQTLSAFRERITQYCYVGKRADDAVGRVEQAFIKVLAAEAIEKNLMEAIRNKIIPDADSLDERLSIALKAGILTQNETQQLRDAENARMDAIAVDEFTLDYFK